jgi:hypothetical protein
MRCIGSGEADVEDFDVLFSPNGDCNSTKQLADSVVVKTRDEQRPLPSGTMLLPDNQDETAYYLIRGRLTAT